MEKTPLNSNVTVEPVAQPTKEPRNYLVTFLLATFGGQLALRNFYIGDKKLGWIRLGLMVGGWFWAMLWLLMGQLMLAGVGSMAMAVAGVWAIIDFFVVYFNVRTDADGQPLTLTVRDKLWAKVIFWVQIVLWSLWALAVLIVLVNFENISKSNIFNNSSSSSQSLNYSGGMQYGNRFGNNPASDSAEAVSDQLEFDMPRAEAEEIIGVKADKCEDTSYGNLDSYESCVYDIDGTNLKVIYRDNLVSSHYTY